MSQIKLNDLINEMGYSMYRDFILSTVDFTSAENKHLKNPYNDFERQPYFINRKSVGLTLTGEEIVFGDYLLFEIGNHQEDTFIINLQSIEEIEEEILSGGGYTNPFTGDMIAIVEGKKKAFYIEGKNKRNQQWERYEKDGFLGNKMFTDTHSGCVVVWE